MNVLAGLTGTASGGMAIVLNAFGSDFMRLATEHGIHPDLMHRITTMSAGTLDALPHNGTVLLLLHWLYNAVGSFSVLIYFIKVLLYTFIEVYCLLPVAPCQLSAHHFILYKVTA